MTHPRRGCSGQLYRLGRDPAGCAVLGNDAGIDAAADIEFGVQAHEARRAGGDQVARIWLVTAS